MKRKIRVICFELAGALPYELVRLHSNAPTTPSTTSSVTTNSMIAESLSRMSIFMILHNRCRSDTLSRSSAISTRGISLGMYLSLSTNFANASRPGCVVFAARMWFSISARLLSSGLGSIMGIASLMSSDRLSSVLWSATSEIPATLSTYPAREPAVAIAPQIQSPCFCQRCVQSCHVAKSCRVPDSSTSLWLLEAEGHVSAISLSPYDEGICARLASNLPVKETPGCTLLLLVSIVFRYGCF